MSGCYELSLTLFLSETILAFGAQLDKFLIITQSDQTDRPATHAGTTPHGRSAAVNTVHDIELLL